MKFPRFFSFISGALQDKAGQQNPIIMDQTVTNAKRYTAEQSMQVSAVWACVDLLSRTFASLPCDVYLRDENGDRYIDKQCSLHEVLAYHPNSYQTAFEFWQCMAMHWAISGNAYALIMRRQDGTARSLHPLNPEQMKVNLLPNGEIVYIYNDRKNQNIEYRAFDIFHWKSLGNGIVGFSKIDLMTASIDENVKAQETSVELYGRKGKLNGILTTDTNILTPQQKKDISEGFATARANGGIPVLPAGLDFKPMSLNPLEAQLNQSRAYSTDDICRWFGVPSAMINASGGATGSSLEQLIDSFYKTTMATMVASCEQAIEKRIACLDERLKHDVVFRLSALNRANDQARASIASTFVQNGLKTRNEIRKEEGLQPIEGGDALTCQNNLVPLDKLGSIDPTQTKQTELTEVIRQ